jgi:hypothetical protein
MLRGRCDGFGLGRLGGACTELTGWFKELVAQVLQLADGRRCLGDAAPTAGRRADPGRPRRIALLPGAAIVGAIGCSREAKSVPPTTTKTEEYRRQALSSCETGCGPA